MTTQLYGTRDEGRTWHVVKDTFPNRSSGVRGVLWLCGTLESGSEERGELTLGETVEGPGELCGECAATLMTGVMG